MKPRARIPLAGIAIALTTCVVLVAAGTGWLLALAAAGVWIASLWLGAPPPPAPSVPQGESFRITQRDMEALIEHAGSPTLMLENERILSANAAARETFGAHVVGQDARVALRHPLAIELLAREGGGVVTIPGLTGPRTRWQMRRQPISEAIGIVELTNRSAEADIGRAHTDFVANASHELRTPLASIIGYVETLIEEGAKLDGKQVAKFHATVLREARRLQLLVADLMSLSRIEAEKHDQPQDRVDLSGLVAQAAHDAAGGERDARLSLAVGGEALAVRGDRQQLEQLVRNLVDNALKYGAAGGKVAVGLERRGEEAVLTVQDEGEGIPAEHLPHLTRRFYRTDPGRSRSAGGTGLGLAIVKHIVERHRGQLEIASRRGEGTTVTVRLPCPA